MTAPLPESPVMGGDAWKERGRHWHCSVVEAPVGQQVDHAAAQQHAATAPEDALAWMQRQAEEMLPRVSQKWLATARRLIDDADLRQIHLSALSWGKSTGATVRLSDDRAAHLLVRSVDRGECSRHG